MHACMYVCMQVFAYVYVCVCMTRVGRDRSERLRHWWYVRPDGMIEVPCDLSDEEQAFFALLKRFRD